jgi:dTDP-4-dehydrorhamnose 3,5-epimerase
VVDLPAGVTLHKLEPHSDSRGTFTELFRVSWSTGVAPVQWNVVRSEAGVLRGVHAHFRHTDYLTLVAGRASVGMFDLRDDSPTRGRRALVELSAGLPAGLVIPPGVAHGFYFHESSLHVYAVSHEWDVDDEMGCRWDDPGLGLDWPCVAPLLSNRDAALDSLASLSAAVNARLRARAAEPLGGVAGS